MIWLYILIAIVFLVALLFFGYYNKFVRLLTRIENSLAQINVQLKKRADLVPNLLKSVKGYMKHEKKIISEVTKARASLVRAKSTEKKAKAGARLQSALKDVFAVAEGYPELKANENFLHLQQELSAIEDKIAYARQYYNDSIMQYNILNQTIPGKWFASMYNFGKKKYLEIPEEEKAAPEVNF